MMYVIINQIDDFVEVVYTTNAPAPIDAWNSYIRFLIAEDVSKKVIRKIRSCLGTSYTIHETEIQ